MVNSRIFSDNGRNIRIDQDFGHARFNVTSTKDIYPVLHYLKWHPEVIKDTFELRKVREKIEVDGEEIEVDPTYLERFEGEEFEIYKPEKDSEHNYAILNNTIKRPMYDILREFALFLHAKKRKLGNIVPRETKIKEVNPYEFNWRDAQERCYYANDSVSTTSAGHKKEKPFAMYIYINRDSEASHDFYLDYLDNLPEANLEKLLTLK